MEEITYEEIAGRRKKKVYAYILIAFLLLFFVAYFLFFLISKKVEYPKDYRTPYIPPPSSFVVNNSYLLPVWNQHNRGTCWAFSTINLLESHYKHQGIMKGYLKDDEYVAFSQEGMMKWMVDKCMAKDAKPLCRSSLRRQNRTNGGSVEEFINFYLQYPDFKKSIVPDTSCPYQELIENQMICPNFYDRVKETPIEFKMSGGELAIGIDKVKDLIYKYKYPLAFSIGMPVSRYWYECDKNHIIANTSMCKDKVYPCKHDKTKYCSFLDYQISKPDSAEMITHSPGNIYYGVGHAMVVVGYNDNFVEPLPLNITRNKPSKGTFILRNSWGSKGHSIEYLSGKISHAQELQICPNPDDVGIWTPVTQKCLKEQNGKGEKCSRDITRVLGGKSYTGGTKLKCVNATHKCVVGRNYYLLRNGKFNTPVIDFLETGTPVATVIDAETFEVLKIETLPIEHLYYAFKVVNPPQNAPERCGYLGYTYDTVNEIVNGQSTGTPEWRTTQYMIEFTDSSYARSHTKGKNYTQVLSSTKTHKVWEPSDPYESFL